jgi:hypothetical protein
VTEKHLWITKCVETCAALPVGTIVSRTCRKEGGVPCRHFGILAVHNGKFGVADFGKDKEGKPVCEHTTFSDFLGDSSVFDLRLERPEPTNPDWKAVLNDFLTGTTVTPYNLITFNCETFVNLVSMMLTASK